MPKTAQRPGPYRRRLHSGQISELTIIDVDSGDALVIYETAELIEAPNWTPDGSALIFNADGRLFSISPDGADGPHRINTAPIENLNNDHVVAPDGRTLFLTSNDGHLYAVPIKGGTPRRITNDHDPEKAVRHYLHGISPDGETLSYVRLEKAGADTIMTRICLIPAAGGKDICLTDGKAMVDGPEFTPDGAWILFNSEATATRPGHAQIFRMRPDGSALEQLTFDERVNWFPHPAPNGNRIAFLSYPPGTEGHPADKEVILKVMADDGGALREIVHLFGGQGTINVNSWSPTGSHLAYVAYPLP